MPLKSEAQGLNQVCAAAPSGFPFSALYRQARAPQHCTVRSLLRSPWSDTVALTPPPLALLFQLFSQHCRRHGLPTMLDTFEILTTSGVVLWSKTYSSISPAIINSLITNVFIEEKTLPGAGIADDVSAANNPPYKYDQHTVKWTTVKELGIIFVVSFRRAIISPSPFTD